jgi:hypothetical protein
MAVSSVVSDAAVSVDAASAADVEAAAVFSTAAEVAADDASEVSDVMDSIGFPHAVRLTAIPSIMAAFANFFFIFLLLVSFLLVVRVPTIG